MDIFFICPNLILSQLLPGMYFLQYQCFVPFEWLPITVMQMWN